MERSLAHQVFLSHATEDRETAVQLCAALEAEGINCWIAPRDVKAGTDYAAAILDAIRTSDLVLLVFSSFADSSPYVLREIERAVNYKRPVLALRIDDTEPSSSMEYYVHVWRRFDASAGIVKKQTEIVAAVREAIAAPRSSGDSRPPDAKKAATLRRWTRRRWWIAAASLIVLAAIGFGLGFGLTRDHAASEAAITGEVRWTLLSPPGTLPVARYAQEMVQDPTSGRLVMFGGAAGTTHFNDTWAYDSAANTWTELKPSGTQPPARGACTMAYDPGTHRLIMFGGYDGTTPYLNDTWAYDPAANAWTELSPSGTVPVARTGPVMAYDPSSRRMIMFGGSCGEAENLNDTWAYDPAANTWTQLKPSGKLPPARVLPAMAYDPAGQRMVMFGGTSSDVFGTQPSDTGYFNDTWAYDSAANTWSELKPAGGLPPARCYHQLVYDPSHGLLIMFGGGDGTDYFNDTWAYHPATNTWTKFSALYVYGVAPAPRAGSSLVYDPSGARLIMFGGAGSDGYFNDIYACALQ